MKIAGARYLTGPNLAGDAPGVSVMIARGGESEWLERPLPDSIAQNVANLSAAGSAFVRRVLAVTELPVSGDAQTLRLVLLLASRSLAVVSAAPAHASILGAGERMMTVFVPCENRQAGMAALAIGAQLTRGAVAGAQPHWDEQAALAALIGASLPPQLLADARSARSRDIPWHRPAGTKALRFGQGRRLSESLDKGDPGRVPTVGITGSVGKTTTGQMTAHILRHAGLTTGFGGTTGMWVNEEQVSTDEFFQQVNGSAILHDPRVEALVLEMPRGGLFSAGAAVDALDVGVMLNILPNHLGSNGFNTIDDIAAVKSIVLRIARKGIVLNAQDERVMALRGVSKAAQTALYSLDPANPALIAHRETGGLCAVRGAEGRLTLRNGSAEILAFDQLDVPAMRAMPLDTFAAAAMAASLSAHLLGIGGDAIVGALATFDGSFAQNPGRNNLIAGLPFELILTMSDGPPGFADLARNLPPTRGGGPSLVCLTAAGDRPDEWIVDTARALGGHFDRYLLFDWHDLRGRAPLETPGLLMRGLRETGVGEDRVTILHDDDKVAQALSLVPHGGRLVLSFAKTADAVQTIRAFAKDHGYHVAL